LVANVSLTPGTGVTGMSWDAVVSRDAGTRMELVPLSDWLSEPDYAAEAARLNQHLGTRWKR
jgi:hypothetical protein